MWSVERAQEFEREIRENPEPRMKYKDSRAVYDLKHMFETSVDLYGDNPAFGLRIRTIHLTGLSHIKKPTRM